MYGEKQYGIIEYAAETESGEEEIYEDLTKIVPPVVTRLKEMYELYHSEGYEIGQLYQALTDVTEQCFITTATWVWISGKSCLELIRTYHRLMRNVERFWLQNFADREQQQSR